MTSAHVFEVTTAGFSTDVVERSTQVPVLLDFWADWCGPCKTLTPVLEGLAEEYGGAFVLGKVNTEANRELSAAFQVQSIPFVVLMVEGRPVDAFAGALPAAEVREFLSRAGVEPLAVREAEDEAEAGQRHGLEQAKRHIVAGEAAAAEALLQQVDEASEFAAEAARLLEGLPWLTASLPESSLPESSLPESSLPESSLPEAAATLARGREALARGDVAAALEEVLASLAVDREFAGGLGRRAMLLLFALIGEDSDEVIGYRRRMATLLY